MTLTIQTVEDELRQLTMTIEVDEARVRKAMQAKARELSREVNLPGFRPGKAPYEVILRRVGEETLRAEAIEELVQSVFEEALEQENIDPYARPTLEDIELTPVVLKFTIPLTPTVTLGDYRALRKDVEEAQVTDEAMEEALEYVRVRHQNIETVERPAERGDVVAISGHGRFTAPAPKPAEEEDEAELAESDATDEAESQGETIFDEERLEILLDEKTLFPDTPFVENVVGMGVGDQKAFTITFPDPYESEPEYAGREASFDLTVLEVKMRELPALDDELAKLEGDYETLDEMREGMRGDLLKSAQDEAKEKLLEEMIDDMLADATLVYPPAAVEGGIDELVEDFKNRLSRSGWKFEDYLNLQGVTEDAIREDFRETAETQLRRQLVLRQFILDEKLKIEAADIDSLIEERTARFDNEGLRKSMSDYYRTGRGFEVISSEVLSNKAYERVRAILSGTAPDLDTLEDETTDEEE